MSEQDDSHYIVAAGVDDLNENDGDISDTEYALQSAGKQAQRLK